MITQIEPWIDDCELEELKKVVKSTYVVEHELTEEFEQRIKELTNAKYAVAMTNGTMALFAAIKALGIGPGDEIIIPNLTFVATANAVILAGATPVLCEIQPNFFTLDIDKAHNLVTQNTKAIIPVHLYGQSADMDTIMAFAKHYNLLVIEDAAQGVGVKYNDKHTGTIGDIGILSFYGNKTITCGEGGIVLTDIEDVAKAVYRLKNHGRDNKGTFIHDYIGYNFSFTEMQAAIGISQLKKLPRIINKKQKIRNYYIDGLKSIGDLHVCPINKHSTPVHWFTSFMSKEKNVSLLTDYLFDKKIQSRRFFYPINLQPCYQSNNTIKNIKEDFSFSKNIYDMCISFPSSYSLTNNDQEKVIESIIGFYEGRN